MIENRNNEIIIVDGLSNYLSTDTRPCSVVRQNQTAPIPAYPYVSYTITNPVVTQGGTYSITKDGTRYKRLEQTWSFTVQSDDQDEALNLALEMYDFFAEVARVTLADRNIIVDRVGNITPRDNLLSIEYEYRNGLDVTFGLLHQISNTGKNAFDEIETVDIGENTIQAPPTVDELNEMLAKRLDGEL